MDAPRLPSMPIRDARGQRVGLRGRAVLRPALTLLELMVVLIILAIVATVAIQALEPKIQSQRLQSAAKLLDEIKVATIGAAEKYQIDGTPLNSGFVSDVGCFPSVPIESSQAAEGFSLRDLWDPDSSLAVTYPFQFRSGPLRPTDYSKIRLPCGWRGPYLQLPTGIQGVVDPWGRRPTLIPGSEGQVERVEIEVPLTRDIDADEGNNGETLAVDLAAGKVTVTGTVLLDDTDQTAVTAVLLAPDPQTSLTTLAVIADEDSERTTFQFQRVPVGFRAVVVDVGNRRQTKYIEVTHRGANLVLDFRQQTN